MAGTGNVAGQQFTGKLADDSMWRRRTNKSSSIARKLGLGDRLQWFTKEGYYEGPVADAVKITDSGAAIAAEKFVYESGYNTTSGFREVTVADQDTLAETQNLLFVPTAIAADASGAGFKHYLLTGYDTSGWANAGDPVYLGAAGALTKTAPSGGNFTKKIGVALTKASSGVVSIDIEGEDIPIHTHVDDANGGTISVGAALTGTTNIAFETYTGTAEPSIAISGSSGGTGDYTQTIQAAATVTTGNATILLPDTAGAGDTIVCKTIAETLANKTLTAPTIGAAEWSNANHTHAGGTTGGLIAASGAQTGTTNNTFDVDSDNGTGVLQLKTTTGGSANTVTLTNTVASGDVTLSLPDATDTLAGIAATQSLTNKTLAGAALTGTLALTTVSCTGAWTDLGEVTTVDINGGTIDGTAIGGAVAAAGAFTTIAASQDVTIAAGKDLILTKGAGEIKINAATSGGIIIKPTSVTTSFLTISSIAQTQATTISYPDVNAATDTLVTLGVANVFSGANTFASITGNDASLGIAGTPGSTGAGGIVAFTGGAGDGAGNAGGALTTVTGAGAAHTTGTGGASGAFTVASGAAGTATSGVGGASGLISVATAAGGAATGATSTGGASGAVSITSGAGGAADNASACTGGAGGALAITGGAGGTSDNAASTGGAGSSVTIYAGSGGASAGGTAGDGGSLTLRAGTGDTAGSILIGATNAAAVGIGRNGIVTTITGDLTMAAGDNVLIPVGDGYFQALGATSGGIKIAPISVGTAVTTLANSNGAAGTLTLPLGTDTLVARATTDTLTNKTLTDPQINGFTENGAAGAVSSVHRIIVRKNAIADGSATAVITVTCPNVAHAAALKITALAMVADQESARCAEGMVIFSREAGSALVGAVATLELDQIATGGTETLTLAYSLSAAVGAAGASNTMDLQFTLDTSAATDGEIVVLAELINGEATGITMAAS